MKIINQLREGLKPKGTARLVGIRFNGLGSGTAFYSQEFINECLDTLELRMTSLAAGMDTFNPLETLAVQLLLSSAHLDKKEL